MEPRFLRVPMRDFLSGAETVIAFICGISVKIIVNPDHPYRRRRITVEKLAHILWNTDAVGTSARFLAPHRYNWLVYFHRVLTEVRVLIISGLAPRDTALAYGKLQTQARIKDR